MYCECNIIWGKYGFATENKKVKLNFKIVLEAFGKREYISFHMNFGIIFWLPMFFAVIRSWDSTYNNTFGSFLGITVDFAVTCVVGFYNKIKMTGFERIILSAIL